MKGKAFLTLGLIELYESSFQVTYLKRAINLNSELINLFSDIEKGGFFIYGNDGENLIARPKEVYDGAMPSGTPSKGVKDNKSSAFIITI